VLNFQITMTLSLFAAAFFMLVGLPALVLLNMDMGEGFVILASTLAIFSILPFILIGIFCTYQGVVNTIRSLSDKPVHYALSIPFVK
jgi:uncharacterized Tic20 family protein